MEPGPVKMATDWLLDSMQAQNVDTGNRGVRWQLDEFNRREQGYSRRKSEHQDARLLEPFRQAKNRVEIRKR
jgi:hypothetical protein